MNRRKFFGAVGSILAAPAIVRAESLMKLWVPPQDIFTGQFGVIESITVYETKPKKYYIPDIYFRN